MSETKLQTLRESSACSLHIVKKRGGVVTIMNVGSADEQDENDAYKQW